MIVLNEAKVNIEINGVEIKPDEIRKIHESVLEPTSIHSDVGHVEVTTENGKRRFKNFGCLFGLEGSTIDENGLKDIVVIQILENNIIFWKYAVDKEKIWLLIVM